MKSSASPQSPCQGRTTAEKASAISQLRLALTRVSYPCAFGGSPNGQISERRNGTLISRLEGSQVQSEFGELWLLWDVGAYCAIRSRLSLGHLPLARVHRERQSPRHDSTSKLT